MTGTSKIHTTLPLPSKIGQIDGIQILRAVAVFLVGWFHSGEPIEKNHPRFLPEFGIFGVDIFFVISGFIMATILLRPTLSAGPAASWYFLKRRLIRIFPIYWVFAALVALRMLRDHALFTQNYLPSIFLAPALTFPNFALLVPFSWTLVFEMVFYYFVALILLTTTRHAVGATVTLICAAVVLGTLVGVRHPVAIIALNPMIIEFVLGTLVALAYQRFGRRRPLGIAILAAGILAALYLRAVPPQAANGMHQVLAGTFVMQRVITWGIAATLIVGGIVFWSPSMKSSVGRFFVLLGNSSYSAYLVSGFVLEFAGRLLLTMTHAGPETSLFVIILLRFIIVASIFLFGWMSYQWIEWPLIRSLSSINKTPEASSSRGARAATSAP